MEWLSTQREKKGISLRELGARLKISHTLVWKIENLEKRLDIGEYVEYCVVLDVSPLDGLRHAYGNKLFPKS